MTADERLAQVRAKIERAEQHIRGLEVEIRAFLDARPYVVGTRRDPATRKLVYYLTGVRNPPPTIAAIAGDVLQNLRSALDHLAYQLFLVGTGSKISARHVYFPIADDAAKYKVKKPGKVKGMRQEAIKAIDAIKPYRGGNDTLWRLHKLNNIDKHRLLITVGSAFHSVDVAPHLQQHLRNAVDGNPAFSDFTKDLTLPPIFLKPADRLFPLKQADELFIDAPDAAVNQKMEFRFDVAFGEPQIIEGEPLLETLRLMADVVEHIISTFRPLLA